MLLVFGVFLASAVQIISSQDPSAPLQNGNGRIPKECMTPPPGVTRHPAACCPIPHLVDDKELTTCGINKTRKAEPPSCETLNCLFTEHKALKPDGKVDEPAFSKYLDDWVKKNPAWEKPASIAKERCLGRELPGPPQSCNTQKLIFCVNDSFLRNCVNWEDSEECKLIRQHAEECDKLIMANSTPN